MPDTALLIPSSELLCASPGLMKRIVFPNLSSRRQLDEGSPSLPALEQCERAAEFPM